MAKATAAELDALLVLISRLTLRQLQRVDTILQAEMLRKMGSPGDAVQEEKTP